MRTIRLLIAYDGTGYCGWQRQRSGPTVQADIEQALSIICNTPTALHGAGRTDAGVHALGMSAHFCTTSSIFCDKLVKGLNALLSRQIRILQADEREKGFHARFQATGKTYRYSFYSGSIQSPLQRSFVSHYPGPVSAAAIELCLEIITGTHDFSSFETSGTRDKSVTCGRGAVRTIFSARLAHLEPDLYHLFFAGDGFLRHMVRNLAGTIIEVGQAKRTPETFERILANRDRQQAGPTAAACGLTLISVDYDNG